jgi:post-segregation antitoxin (ccd killing protein)
MASSILEDFNEYINRLRGRPLAHLGVDEETAPDIAIALTTTEKPTPPLSVFEIDPSTITTQVDFELFLDGVQKTTPIKLCTIEGGLEIPIHLIQCVAGICERRGGRLFPFFHFGPLQILALPFRAIRDVDPSFPRPPGEEIGPQRFLYDFLMKNVSKALWVDTSVPFSQFGKSKDLDPYEAALKGRDLVSMGELKRRARDKAVVITRILELGMFKEARTKYGEKWLVCDGPIAPLLKYSGDVSADLSGLQNLSDPYKAYELLKGAVGVVKSVQIVPDQGLQECFRGGRGKFRIPVYVMRELVKGVDAVGRAILSGFAWLRGELISELGTIWSPASGLVRFDIPYPTFIEKGEDWYLEGFKPDLNNPTIRSKVEGILASLISERWPHPSAWGSRVLVELYPIAETEAWLHSLLLPSQELSALIR